MTEYSHRLGLVLFFFAATAIVGFAQTFRIGPQSEHGEEVVKLFAPEVFDSGAFEIHEYTQNGADVVEVYNRITGNGDWFFYYAKNQPTIYFATLGMTCYGAEVALGNSEDRTIVAFDSLQTKFALESEVRGEWGRHMDWIDSGGTNWLEAPDTEGVVDDDGYIACKQHLRSDSTGSFSLPNDFSLLFSNLFQPDEEVAVLSWSLEDKPILTGLEYENDFVFDRSLLEMFLENGGAGWVYNGFTPHPAIEYAGYVGASGSGIGVFRYAYTDTFYAGEILDWEHNGEGVWQTRSKFDPSQSLFVVQGNWVNGDLLNGTYSVYFDGALCAMMMGEFFTENELINLELSEWHAEQMGIYSQGQNYIRWQPMHLKRGVFHSCLMEESTLVPGSVIQVVCN